jgi:hypothetical protein
MDNQNTLQIGEVEATVCNTRCEVFNLLPSLARVIATRNYSPSIHQSVPHTSQQVTTAWANDEDAANASSM